MKQLTKDGYEWKDLEILYYLNSICERIDTYYKKDLQIDGKGYITRTDGKDFAFHTGQDLIWRKFFGSISGSNQALYELRNSLNDKETDLETKEKRYRLIRQYEQDNSPKLRISSDKVSEFVGKIKIS